MATKKGSKHAWRFFRAGGVDQVALARGADLSELPALDQKLWVALACPTRGLEIDSRTLDFIDTDHDGRIRPPEILAAVTFAKQAFKNLDDLFEGGDAVPLASINDESEAGVDLLAGARRILANLGDPGATAITLAHVADTEKIFAATKFNGDGIVPAESADEPETRRAIEDILATMGGLPDRSGKPGVNEDIVGRFFDQATAYADWVDRGQGPAVRILGEATDDGASALFAVFTKVDDYFARCRLASYDARIAPGLNASDGEIAALAGCEIAPDDAAVSKLPLGRCEAGRPLPLGDGLNPAWRGRIAAFVDKALTPLLGQGQLALSEGDWAEVQRRFLAYREWFASRPAEHAVAALGAARVRELARGGMKKSITDLIARDAALATESNQIEAVEKMIRLRRDLVPLLRNFVNFGEFYGTRRGAFQSGTLFVDGRSCDLCMPVADVARHATLAGLARAYLVYCDCTRRTDPGKIDPVKMTIVAAVTGGDVDSMIIGRNGVFYDRHGEDWDATITRIIENPISVRQAFWAPYKRFMRLIEEQVAKRAAAADADSDKVLHEEAAGVVAGVDGKPEAKPDEKEAAKPPPERKIDVGTVAAIGVAVGGIATFFSSILATFLGLGMWMPAGILALILAISGPSMLIAWLKLQQRNIGPILDANGWAVNAFARINVPFGGALTSVARLPAGAARTLEDPFAEKSRPWRLYAFIVVVLSTGAGYALGKFDAYLPDPAKSVTIIPWPAPPAPPPAPPAPAH